MYMLYVHTYTCAHHQRPLNGPTHPQEGQGGGVGVLELGGRDEAKIQLRGPEMSLFQKVWKRQARGTATAAGSLQTGLHQNPYGKQFGNDLRYTLYLSHKGPTPLA